MTVSWNHNFEFSLAQCVVPALQMADISCPESSSTPCLAASDLPIAIDSMNEITATETAVPTTRGPCALCENSTRALKNKNGPRRTMEAIEVTTFTPENLRVKTHGKYTENTPPLKREPAASDAETFFTLQEEGSFNCFPHFGAVQRTPDSRGVRREREIISDKGTRLTRSASTFAGVESRALSKRVSREFFFQKNTPHMAEI